MKYFVIGIAMVVCLLVSTRLFPRKPYAGPRPTLRQFGDLTPKDFEAHPVWVNCHVIDYDQPWYADTDEETFRPWLKSVPVDAAQTMFLVRASLRLADGTVLSGFITPQNPKDYGGEPDFGLIQPQLFLPTGKRVSFWFGNMAPPEKDISEFYTILAKREANVFPLTFAAEAGLATGVVTGAVPGFCFMSLRGEVKVRK